MNHIEILPAIVAHRRLFPKQNEFVYNVFYVAVPITNDRVSMPHLFSMNRFNVMSLYTKDHGAQDGSAWRAWIVKQCDNRSITVAADDEIFLISHPRLFGFVFNPISFWVVREKNTYVKAVLCEVRNTFGDNHNYLLAHEDCRAIRPEDIFTARKGLYVSPFNHVEKGSYAFSFDVTADAFSTAIDYFESDTHILEVSMAGSRKPLTTIRLLSAVVCYPLMTLAIVYRIHVQAVRLYFKGVQNTLAHRPPPTSGKTTHGSTKK